MIPACGGSWLSPQPFDWAAVMGERQLGGRGRKGAAAIAYTAVTAPPRHPLQPEWQKARDRRSGHWGWGGGLGVRRECPRSEAWCELGVSCQGALLTRGGWAPSEVSWRSLWHVVWLPRGWPSKDPGPTRLEQQITP